MRDKFSNIALDVRNSNCYNSIPRVKGDDSESFLMKDQKG